MYGRPWISASRGQAMAVLYLGKRPWFSLSFSTGQQTHMIHDSEDTSCPFLRNVQKCAETSYKSSGNKILVIIYIEENTLTFLKTARLVGQTPF